MSRNPTLQQAPTAITTGESFGTDAAAAAVAPAPVASSTVASSSGVASAIGRSHCRRLRTLWRSAGWPCQDLIEVELLSAGLIERRIDAAGRETLRVTDTGVALLDTTLQRNRAVRNAHEALVERVALQMQRAGRIVWRGLSLRAPPHGADARLWPMAMPDVYSIRHTTVEAYVEPIVHEVKVRRADLLSDLRHEAKRAAYLALSSQCWYVLKAGIGNATEIPPEHGVLFAHEGALEVARPAPKRPIRLPLGVWMALARADAERALDDDAQRCL